MRRDCSAKSENQRKKTQFRRRRWWTVELGKRFAEFFYFFAFFNWSRRWTPTLVKLDSATELPSSFYIFFRFLYWSRRSTPTSAQLNSATALPSSNLISEAADVEFNIFRILKITKICRNSISSITFDRELHFWHKNTRWKAYEILYKFTEDCIS